jgi:hypothetical protein
MLGQKDYSFSCGRAHGLKLPREAYDCMRCIKAPPGAACKSEKEKQADALIRIGKAAELFQAPDGVLWARFKTGGHFENWPIRTKGTGFRRWLVSEYFKKGASAPSATAVQSAIEVLEAEAQFGEGRSKREVFTRVAGHEGAVYLDLGDDTWRAVKIAAEGWQIVAAPPVCFRRTRGMLPLPEPKQGGSLRLLDDIVNLGSEEDRQLLLAWTIFTLNPNGPYPLLALKSEQGSGKSTTAKYLRMTIDPNQAPIRALPKNVEDLAVAAQHSWVPCFDNLSYLSDAFSDALCRLSTGGGVGGRALYTNDEEFLFWAKRPVILNGISEFASRPDLLERTLIVSLPTIPPKKRLSEGAIKQRFQEVRAELLGALLDAACLTLCELPNVHLCESPRMADFAQWSAAAAPAIGAAAGAVVDLVFEKQQEALLSELDAPLPQAIFDLLDARNGALEIVLPDLLVKLGELAGEEATRKAPGWPKSPRGLLSAITRIAPVMRAADVSIEVLGRTARGRKVFISRNSPKSLSDGAIENSAGCAGHTPCFSPLSTLRQEFPR